MLLIVCISLTFVGLGLTKSNTQLMITSYDFNFNRSYVTMDLQMGRRQTAGLVNLTINFLVDLPGIEDIEVIVYRWIDNQYKPSGIYFKKPACEVMRYIRRAMDFSNPMAKNFQLTCPMKKGVYFLRNVPMSIINVPYIPQWKAKVIETFMQKNYLIWNITVYVETIEKLY